MRSKTDVWDTLNYCTIGLRSINSYMGMLVRIWRFQAPIAIIFKSLWPAIPADGMADGAAVLAYCSRMLSSLTAVAYLRWSSLLIACSAHCLPLLLP